MTPRRGRRWPAALLPLLFAPLPPAQAGQAASEVRAGAYCPLPKQGETPRCLGPAMQEYGGFFSALSNDAVDEKDVERMERDLTTGGGSEKAYLALSSLAYGYWRLSQRAAAEPGDDPAIAGQLERWNAALALAYEKNPEDPGFRAAVREAALDVSRRAPPVRLRCVDEQGATTACDSTDAVLRGVDAVAGEAGIGAGLQRLIERIFGSEGS